MSKQIIRHKSDENALILEGAQVVGDVSWGPGCGIWFNAVLRGDDGPITLGRNTNIQDNAVIHTAPGGAAKLGDNVSVGHGAILHGCTVGDNTLIGMGAIVMDDAVVGSNCLVAAGALVPSGMVIPDGSLVVGSPAAIKRPVTERDLQYIRANAEEYVEKRELYR